MLNILLNSFFNTVRFRECDLAVRAIYPCDLGLEPLKHGFDIFIGKKIYSIKDNGPFLFLLVGIGISARIEILLRNINDISKVLLDLFLKFGMTFLLVRAQVEHDNSKHNLAFGDHMSLIKFSLFVFLENSLSILPTLLIITLNIDGILS